LRRPSSMVPTFTPHAVALGALLADLREFTARLT
jgi:hypothetical protein